MNELSLEDLAAIVNFVEGEGCINISKNFNRNTGHYVLNITVSNTNKEKLNWMRNILGIGQIEIHARETIKSKKSWQFDLAVHEMKEFLELLIHSKYLMIKKYQTLVMLEWFEKQQIVFLEKDLILVVMKNLFLMKKL